MVGRGLVAICFAGVAFGDLFESDEQPSNSSSFGSAAAREMTIRASSAEGDPHQAHAGPGGHCARLPQHRNPPGPRPATRPRCSDKVATRGQLYLQRRLRHRPPPRHRQLRRRRQPEPAAPSTVVIKYIADRQVQTFSYHSTRFWSTSRGSARRFLFLLLAVAMMAGSPPVPGPSRPSSRCARPDLYVRHLGQQARHEGPVRRPSGRRYMVRDAGNQLGLIAAGGNRSRPRPLRAARDHHRQELQPQHAGRADLPQYEVRRFRASRRVRPADEGARQFPAEGTRQPGCPCRGHAYQRPRFLPGSSRVCNSVYLQRDGSGPRKGALRLAGSARISPRQRHVQEPGDDELVAPQVHR